MKQLTYTIIILSLALTLACARAFGTPEEDSMLQHEVRKAALYWGKALKVIPFKVQMVDKIDGGHIGVCYLVEGKGQSLQIDRHYWYSVPYITRLFLVTHEVGHCLLGLPDVHDESSVMNWQVYDTVQHNKPILIRMSNELFNRVVSK